MLDHISLGVSDLERSRAFYQVALDPLGMTPVYEFDDATGYGRDGNPLFWIGRASDASPSKASTSRSRRNHTTLFTPSTKQRWRQARRITVHQGHDPNTAQPTTPHL